MAAYLNTLTFSLGENQLWFGKHPMWKVHSGIYCSYNAFSRVDVRVLVQIPGSVEAYVVDEKGDKRPATEEHWTEAYLSAMLRALLYSDDDIYYLTACRKLDPLVGISSTGDKFFDAFEKLFYQGPSLGSVSEVQVPTIVNNLLIDGFFKFVKATALYDKGIEVVERIRSTYDEPAVVPLLSKLYILKNQEVEAVQTMANGILESPRDAVLLEQEAEFCQRKGRFDLALDCAIRAVNASPSEFYTWSRLVEVYTKMGDYEQALLTLNSCPMFTYHDLDQHRMPQPSRVHLPLPTDGILEEVWNVESKTIAEQQKDVTDGDLLKLPAPTLRSTFAKAYELLTAIVSNIGWESLLKYRTRVFVMEEEYRKDKIPSESTTRSRVNSTSQEQPGSTTTPADSVKPPEEAKTSAAAPDTNGTTTTTDDTTNTNNENNENNNSNSTNNNDQTSVTGIAPQSKTGGVGELRNKRLCERWLDNLFMVLYEDLRVYTVWRAEYIHYQSQQMEYKKSALEWEILGMVAHRLHHKEEAAEAFTESLKLKFSHRVLWKLLDYYLEKNKQHNKSNAAATQAALDTIVKLVAWNHRWYCEFSPTLYQALRSIVASEGLVKVRSSIEAQYNQQGVLELMQKFLNQLEGFKAPGTEN